MSTQGRPEGKQLTAQIEQEKKPFESFGPRGLQEALDFHLAHLHATYTVIARLREGLKGRCDHVKTEPYVWEHDNGYGRQTDITGKRCVHCLFVDLWNRGQFVDPEVLS